MKNLLFTLIIFITSACFMPAFAQTPTWAATQNWLDNVSHSTCMQRSKAILQQNNFSVRQQDDNVSFIGEKDAWYAYLTCQSCGDKTITTIVISTSGTQQAAVELRERLLYYIATGKTGTGTTTSAQVNLWLDKSSFSVGEKITVHYSGMPGNAQDWVSLVEKGKPDNQFGPWKYTESKKDGSMLFDALPAGEYETRAYFNNGYNVEKRVYFSVTGGTVNTGGPATGTRLKLDKSTYVEGEKIVVTYFNLPGNATDWIAMAEAGKPETQYGQWFHTQGKTAGTMEFNGLWPGNYEARLFYNNSYKLEEKLSFKVATNPGGNFIIKTAKTVFAQTEPIPVQFSNSQGADNDWVSICKAGSPDGQYGQWFYKGKLASGDLTFNALPAGDYEIRYYLKGGYEVGKRINIRVVK
ncbi:MAG: hypothetical protein HY842_17785 [Bacteroidetes bacterium]|nr:hypothetical protein [Bacteroidota bacterium]